MSEDIEKNLNPKDRGLGRGLDALFGDGEEESYPHFDVEEVISDSVRKIIGIEKLFPCPDQPRRHFDEQAIKELSLSISEHGVIQPILVRPDKTRDGMYEIIAGERRWRASQKAQLHEVPVVIKDIDDATAFQMALIENIQRQDLNAIEEAKGYERLVEDFGHSHDDVGQALGKSRSHIANMIRLLQLPDSVQTMMAQGELSAGHARAILKAEHPVLTAQEVVSKKLSVRETEKLVADNEGRAIKHRNKSSPKSIIAKKDADTLALEKEVSDQLGMSVFINMKNVHEGQMTIDFKNLDQLDDVLQRLAQTPKKLH